MAQSDLDVQNADGATVRADINSQLEALATQNSGSTAPPVTFPLMPWHDTANQQLKERNAANTAWRVVADIVDGELVPYSAGESADVRYVRLTADNTLSGNNTHSGSNSFTQKPTAEGSPVVTEEGLGEEINVALNASGEAPLYACRAWVNFDGTTTPPTIRASGNVSSVTRNSTGKYDIAFIEPITGAGQDAAVVTGGERSSTSVSIEAYISNSINGDGGGAVFRMRSTESQGYFDAPFCSLAVLR